MIDWIEDNYLYSHEDGGFYTWEEIKDLPEEELEEYFALYDTNPIVGEKDKILAEQINFTSHNGYYTFDVNGYLERTYLYYDFYFALTLYLDYLKEKSPEIKEFYAA